MHCGGLCRVTVWPCIASHTATISVLIPRYYAHKISSDGKFADDYFIWETHIFFDDAMEPDDDGIEFQINSFVRLLIQEVETQGKKWYSQFNMKVRI